MSNNKYAESDPERTLLTLDQLSQTIEVMTSVVNRLRQHLSEQILARKVQEQEQKQTETEKQHGKSNHKRRTRGKKKLEATVENSHAENTGVDVSCPASAEDRESFVVEITQPETEPQPKNNKTLH